MATEHELALGRERNRRYRERHRERVRASARATNAKRAHLISQWHREHRERVREISRNSANRWHLHRREKLAGRPRPQSCELCGRANQARGKGLHFDHDHATGDFRGWLCHNCNLALGLAGDNPDIIRKWLEYIEQGGFGSGPAAKTVDAVLRTIETVSC